MNNLMLCDQTVRVDDNGLVCLTDMWKASGKKGQHAPALFLRNDKVKDFIQSLEAKVQKCTLSILKGGKTPGTWAHKLVAYKYASWIDPVFEVGAYTVLDKFFSGDLVHKGGWDALHDVVMDERLSKERGTYHGKGLAQRRAEKALLKERHRQLLQTFQLALELE